MSASPKPCTDENSSQALPQSFFDPASVTRGVPRKSKTAARRAWVLGAVHVLLFAHLLHWFLSGRSLSLLEPSEAMYTMAQGVINAGMIFLVIVMASTLVFGRWFCGWGCHIVALQDLCGWIMKKLGVRPRAIRSRAVVWVPLAAGLFMFFINPIVGRYTDGLGVPEWRLGLMKSDLWETMPGFWIGGLTLAWCGFVSVYFLGAKGFCIYACPYGGLFRLADKFAIGRIRVTDACRACGHCSAVCSSNVQVHREVLEFGMVVDGNCMKTGDCISVCPQEALYFGMGKPAVLAKRRRKAKARLLDFTWKEEVALLAVFAITLFVFIGLPRWVVNWADALYGKLPLLFSLGLAAVTSFFALMFWRLVRRQDAQFLGATLRLDGGPLTSRGRMMTVVCGVWLLFVGHCGVHQYLMFQAQRAIEKTSVGGAAWAQDHAVLSNLPARTSAAIDDGRRYLEWAQSWGIIDDVRARRNLAWLALLSENLPEAETQLTAATQLEPDHANSFHDLHRVRLLRGDVPGACDALIQVIALTPNEERPRLQLALLYGGTRNLNAAEATLRDAVRVLPDSIELNRLLGMLLMDMGRPDEARPFLESIPK